MRSFRNWQKQSAVNARRERIDMLALKNVPIKRKLMLISMLASCVALLLACAAFVTYDQMIFRRSMVLDLSITAEMISSNCAAALSFSEPTSAEDTLKSL